jgi:hypothetical protein
MSSRSVAVLWISLLALVPGVSSAGQAGTLRPPDVIFVPTQDTVAQGMLALAGVTKNDVVYDLGSGDGKIVIMAAQKFGARRRVDINGAHQGSQRQCEGGQRADGQLRLGDIFDPALESTTRRVTLCLLPSLNEG